MSAAGVTVIKTAPSTMRERSRAATPLLPCSDVDLEKVAEQQHQQQQQHQEEQSLEGNQDQRLAVGDGGEKVYT